MKQIVTSFLFAAMALAASAEILTPAQALQRASGQFRVASLSDAVTATPAMTVNASDRLPALYVFGSPESTNGFAILSADDIAVPVLGYADRGGFSASEIPDNMQAWLNFYAEEIAAARDSDISAGDNGRIRMTRPMRAPIEPICKTTWNQDAPYNNLCPKEGSTSCFTGCVATAMAQVLKTFEYPTQCTGGEYTYKYLRNGSERQLTLDYDDVTFDWAEMLDAYSGTATASQRNAVANLMYAVGVISNMSYGTDYSGANAAYTAQGLIRNLDYSRSLTYEMREWYDFITWENMIYSTLEGGHAAYYDGQSSETSNGSSNMVGHAFVVDGYSGDGYFHLNWGWGGMSDGYFLLSALDPSNQGIGGLASGYNFRQGTIINMAPKKDRVVAPIVFAITHGGSFGVQNKSVIATSDARVTFTGHFYNISPCSVANSRFATRYTASDGTQTYADGLTPLPALDLYLGPEYFVCKVPTDLADGRYIVSPVMKSSGGRYYDVRCDVGGYGELVAEVSSSLIQFSNPQYASVDVVEADVPSSVYSGTRFTINGLVRNATEQWYSGGIRGAFVRRNGSSVSKIVESDAAPVEAAPMSDSDFSLTLTTPSNLAMGSYQFCLTDYKGNIISDLYEISIGRNPGRAEFSSSTLTVASTAADNLRFEVNANATAGYYNGQITVAVREANTSSSQRFLSNNFNISAGEKKLIPVEGSYYDAKAGVSYTAQAFVTINGRITAITDVVSFTMSDPILAIDQVQDADANAVVEYFDLYGRSVDNPRPGSIYIMRRGDVTVKVKL